MSGLLTVRNFIRDFLRKYEEITTPVIHFVAAFIMFSKLNDLFGYSSLFDRDMVTFWLSLICALVSSQVVMIVAGLVVVVNAFAVSTEIGILWTLFIIALYCLYMRMFPKCSFILGVTVVLFAMDLQYAIPFIVVMYAGIAGIVPAAMGVVTYQFALCTKEARTLILAATEEDSFNSYSYIIDAMTKNKEMILFIVVFAIVVMISTVVYMLPVNYSWYIAIGVGGLLNIICFMICSANLGVDISIGTVFLSTMLGILIALVAQFFKGIVDYSKKEVVQFEDDDYYYYVTAIPKYDTDQPSKKASLQTKQLKTDAEVMAKRERQTTDRTAVSSAKSNTETNENRQRTARPSAEANENRQRTARPGAEANENRQRTTRTGTDTALSRQKPGSNQTVDIPLTKQKPLLKTDAEILANRRERQQKADSETVQNR